MRINRDPSGSETLVVDREEGFYFQKFLLEHSLFVDIYNNTFIFFLNLPVLRSNLISIMYRILFHNKTYKFLKISRFRIRRTSDQLHPATNTVADIFEKRYPDFPSHQQSVLKKRTKQFCFQYKFLTGFCTVYHPDIQSAGYPAVQRL